MPSIDLKLVDELLLVFREIHGEIPFDLVFVPEVVKDSNADIKGACDFNQSPTKISIRNNLDSTNLIEILFHELAHLVCGIEAEHNNEWELCKDELSIQFAALRIKKLLH